jgi:hypothetical protein
MLFKKIKDFDNYWISFNGDVYSDYKNDFLNSFIISKNCNYKRVSLCKDKQKHLKSIHRLVAESFLDNKNNFQFVDHIDRNTLNNDVDNLRWVTIQQNGHNRIDNNEEFNIQKRKDGYGYNVQFKKISHTIQKTFKSLNEAIIFRDLIQLHIDFDIKVNPLWLKLYNKEMRCINKSNKGFNVIINRKYYGTFKTLQEAKTRRNEILINQ